MAKIQNKKNFQPKNLFILGIITMIFGTLFFNMARAEIMAERLKGRILLQVESRGEAWYVDPRAHSRVYLGRPADAFRIMQGLGLGISENLFSSFAGLGPASLTGMILLRVEDLGQAYYVNPADLKLYYLGRPADAFRIMQSLGLGITNNDLEKIGIMKNKQTPADEILGEPGDADEKAYPWHENITATVFWAGEPVGNGSSEDNAFSAWDDEWQEHFGGYDDPYCREGYYPCGFTPKENPFYVSVPFSDFTDEGERKAEAYEYVPWADEQEWADSESMIKNRWVKITRGEETCYGQVQDTGPYEYNDYNYVFLNSKPINKQANAAGMDVSPALRDCLKFTGLNNADNKINWQFVDFKAVPDGPWLETVTTAGVNWD